MHELIENALDRLAKDGWASFCIPSRSGGAMEKTSLEIAHSIGVLWSTDPGHCVKFFLSDRRR